jgi:hypothetical protein
MRAALLPLLLLAAPALAEPLDGPGFDALVTGRSFSIIDPSGAEPYGVEHYFPGGRVTWRWIETGECEEGRWYESQDFAGGPAICFDYADDATYCWRYEAEGKGMWGTSLSSPGSTEVIEGYRLDPAPGATFCEWLGA